MEGSEAFIAAMTRVKHSKKDYNWEIHYDYMIVEFAKLAQQLNVPYFSMVTDAADEGQVAYKSEIPFS